jgi:hypothetical protein
MLVSCTFDYHWFQIWVCDPHHCFESGCLHLQDVDKESMFMTLYNIDLNQQ